MYWIHSCRIELSLAFWKKSTFLLGKQKLMCWTLVYCKNKYKRLFCLKVKCVQTKIFFFLLSQGGLVPSRQLCYFKSPAFPHFSFFWSLGLFSTVCPPLKTAPIYGTHPSPPFFSLVLNTREDRSMSGGNTV